MSLLRAVIVASLKDKCNILYYYVMIFVHAIEILSCILPEMTVYGHFLIFVRPADDPLLLGKMSEKLMCR